jgi:peptide/nickel transport system permease protein
MVVPTYRARTSLEVLRDELNAFRASLAYFWYQMRRNAVSLLGLMMILLVIVLSVLAPVIAPYDPIQGDLLAKLYPPSLAHPMGTDDIGRDLLSRVLFGGRVDLLIAIASVTLSLITSFILGSLAGYFGGWVDEVIMRITDVVMSFPGFLLAIALAVALGPGKISSIIIALGIEGAPPYLRLMRGEVLSKKESLYVEAARAVGNSDFRIMALHLLPNTLSPLIVQATLGIGYVILEAAGLSFVGVGVADPTPEWGIMISQGTRFILGGMWWPSIFPGLMIFLSVLGFNLFGDALRDIINPRTRRR